MLGDISNWYILSNISDVEDVFRPPDFFISYVTPTVDLNTLLYNLGGLFIRNYEPILLLGVVRVTVPGIGMYILFNSVASKEYGDWFDAWLPST